jgi:ComEC/Rec2-related protein
VTTVETSSKWRFLRQNPLVPAAVAFLLGAGIAPYLPPASAILLALSVAGWILCLLLELRRSSRGKAPAIALTCALITSGLTLWQLNQEYGDPGELVRFASAKGELPVTLRARVIVPPSNDEHHGNAYWVAEATEIFTNSGWLPAAGIVQVKWRTGLTAPTLARGDAVEMYGWLSRPAPAMNPGALDLRQRLAADRVFAEVRVPRASGVVRLAPGDGGHQPTLLTRVRLALRAKLLAHTAALDPDAAHTLVALVLGYRDPSMDDISRSFADAGVGHLLAISGSHVVFFAAVVWLFLRFLPMRPRWREPLTTVIVLAYVLATPCGPPVMRAAIGVGMVLISRLLGRPRAYMNMLAAAAMLIVILRPTDLFDAGFQLTFLCTAALLLLLDRVHNGLFGRLLERQLLLADLAQTRSSRIRFRILRWTTLALVANGIGAVVSMPLVMHHFNQINLYGVFSGILAFPLVALTMMAGLIQLALEWAWAGAGALFAPLSTLMAHGTVWLIGKLAAIPGAAIGVRTPPAWIVAILYAPIVLWALRRWISIKRAVIVNGLLAAIGCAVAWYGFTAPIGALRLQVLNVGQGSALLMTTPRGETWVINAGSRDLPNPMATALAPALRVAGVRTLNGVMLTSVDAVHASTAGELIDRFRPPVVVTCGSPEAAGWTFAADRLTAASDAAKARTENVRPGDRVSGVIHVLGTDSSQLVIVEFAGRRILLADSESVAALTLLPLNGVDLHCDAVVVVSPERGQSDEALRRLLDETGATVRIWSGRGAWAPKTATGGDRNTADGWVDLRIEGDGKGMAMDQTAPNGS